MVVKRASSASPQHQRMRKLLKLSILKRVLFIKDYRKFRKIWFWGHELDRVKVEVFFVATIIFLHFRETWNSLQWWMRLWEVFPSNARPTKCHTKGKYEERRKMSKASKSKVQLLCVVFPNAIFPGIPFPLLPF